MQFLSPLPLAVKGIREVRAIADFLELLANDDICRKIDISKSVVLGAKAVLLERPFLWGLAIAEEAGVQHVIELLHDELDVAMTLSNCVKLQDIDPSLVVQL